MVVVDPGPEDDEHIARIAELGKIPLVLISHKHDDHTGGIDKIVELTGAVVRSVGSGFLRGLGGPLTEGEVIDAAGLRITVMATPGHTADSVSFLLDDAVLTADTVLGRGTTVIDNEDGSLGEYMESLRRLHGLGQRTVLPGHGPDLDDLEAVSAMYLAHREERLDQVRAALRVFGDDASDAPDRRARLHRRRRKAVGRSRMERPGPAGLPTQVSGFWNPAALNAVCGFTT